MGRKTTRKYGVYNALEIALRKSGVIAPGKVASLLLDSFLQNEGVITKYNVEKAGLCETEGFKTWREPLIKAGWLQYDFAYAKAIKKGSIHQPGKLLIPYLNKEKMKSKELATQDDIRRVDYKIAVNEQQNEMKLESLRSELDGVKELVKMIISRLDDPYTEEKFVDYSNNPEKMLRLISNQVK